MKYIVILVLLLSSLFAEKLQYPVATFKSSGNVNDMVIKKNKLYSATDASCVDVFDMNSKKIIKKIKVDKIVDFMGDRVDAKVYSVDVLDNSVVLLSQGEQGFSKVFIYKDGKLTKIIDDSDELDIVQAKYINKNTLLLALVSNEIISYNIDTKKQNYRVQVSQSKFSNFVLNEGKNKVVVADESGVLQILDTKNGKNIKTLSGKNLDNIFQVDYKNEIIATAGKDRRIVVYNTVTNVNYYKTSSFFIYSVGLSPSGKFAAYSSDINNDVSVFNTQTKEIISKLGGNKMTISKILFLDENDVFVATGGVSIHRYEIK